MCLVVRIRVHFCSVSLLVCFWVRVLNNRAHVCHKHAYAGQILHTWDVAYVRTKPLKISSINFIILVLFSYGLLINSLFPVDLTSDLSSYYFATILHLGALFKSHQVFG